MNEGIIVRLLLFFYDIFIIFVTVFRNINMSITNMDVLKRLYLRLVVKWLVRIITE